MWVGLLRLSQFLALETAREICEGGREGQDHAGGKTFYAGVRAKLFWRVIYCVKTSVIISLTFGRYLCYR